MRRICVYCGSNSGGRSEYTAAAQDLAGVLVRHELELVYGGADMGIMGVIADAVLEQGGKVHGVIPQMLCEKEIAHQGLTELHVVASMHARKTMMAALSDGCYFDHLLAYLDNASAEGFLRKENRDMLLCDPDPAGLIHQFERYAAPHVEKWMT
jgi:predicted Rossmann-fold nucleotide-binding protein